MTIHADKQNSGLRSLCVSGKKRYRTQERAEQALRSALDRAADGDPKRRKRRVYECNLGCGGWHLTSHQIITERKTAVRPVSPKRTTEQRQRTRMLREVFGPNPLCAVPDCGKPADDAHEALTRARGGSITDPDNVFPLCRAHHDQITFAPESEKQWAYDLGLLRHSWEDSA